MAQTDCRPPGNPLEETLFHSAIVPRNSFFVPAFLAQFLGGSVEEWREKHIILERASSDPRPGTEETPLQGPQTSLRSLRKVGRRQVYAVCARSKGDIAEQSEQCAVNAS